MITNINPAVTVPNVSTSQTAELIGLSTDTKPTTDIPNGSVFIETDTAKIYLFNKTSGQWVQFA